MSVCKTQKRIEHIYTSTSSSVQVYLKSDGPIIHHNRASNVLLKYEGRCNALVGHFNVNAVGKP